MPSPGPRSTARARSASCAPGSGASASGGRPSLGVGDQRHPRRQRRSGFIEIDAPESRSRGGAPRPAHRRRGVTSRPRAPACRSAPRCGGSPPRASRWPGSFPTGNAWHADLLGASQEIDGILLRGAFDLLTALEQLLEHDCADFLTGPADPLPGSTIVLGRRVARALVGRGRRAGRRVRRPAWRDRHRSRRRGAERHAARRPAATSAPAPGCWAASSAARSSARGRWCGAR